MEKELPTYDNDKQLSQLLYSEITDDTLLNLFFQKGGTVNITNLNYLVGTNSKNDFSRNLISLESKGLVKSTGSHTYKVTAKARWSKLRDSKALIWVVSICAVASFAILLMQVLKLVK
jgi:predicted transcriptional regulator